MPEQFEEEETEAPLGATLSGRKRLFSKELRCMMFGFGDDQNPYTESVDMLEDLVIEFITEMVRKDYKICKSPFFICTYLTQHKQTNKQPKSFQIMNIQL